MILSSRRRSVATSQSPPYPNAINKGIPHDLELDEFATTQGFSKFTSQVLNVHFTDAVAQPGGPDAQLGVGEGAGRLKMDALKDLPFDQFDAIDISHFQAVEYPDQRVVDKRVHLPVERVLPFFSAADDYVIVV